MQEPTGCAPVGFVRFGNRPNGPTRRRSCTPDGRVLTRGCAVRVRVYRFQSRVWFSLGIERRLGKEREELESLLSSLPADSAEEDVQYRRYVLEKIRLGLTSAEMQPAFTQEEAEARLRTWFASPGAGSVPPD